MRNAQTLTNFKQVLLLNQQALDMYCLRPTSDKQGYIQRGSLGHMLVDMLLVDSLEKNVLLYPEQINRFLAEYFSVTVSEVMELTSIHQWDKNSQELYTLSQSSMGRALATIGRIDLWRKKYEQD